MPLFCPMKNFIDYDIWVPQGTDKPGVMIILDPGHGGLYNGKYTTAPAKMCDHGDFVFFEGVFNREMVIKIANQFKKNNIAHAFTTISNLDESLDARGVKVGNIKSSYHKYNHLVMSIHANAGPPQAHGTEFWTTKELNDSDLAANFFFPYLQETGFKLRINREKENEYDKEESWKILRLSEKKGCMAILWEMGFFTNREEAITMLTGEWQDKVALSLLKGTQDLIKQIQTYGTIKKN